MSNHANNCKLEEHTSQNPKYPRGRTLLQNNNKIDHNQNMYHHEKHHGSRFLSQECMACNEWCWELEDGQEEMQNIPRNGCRCALVVTFLRHNNKPKDREHELEKAIQFENQQEDLACSETGLQTRIGSQALVNIPTKLEEREGRDWYIRLFSQRAGFLLSVVTCRTSFTHKYTKSNAKTAMLAIRPIS